MTSFLDFCCGYFDVVPTHESLVEQELLCDYLRSIEFFQARHVFDTDADNFTLAIKCLLFRDKKKYFP